MTDATAPGPAAWRHPGLYSPWADRALLVAFVFLLRSAGFAHSVIADWDEAMYALMARELIDGGLPYVTMFQEKPLGPTVLVAAAFTVLGKSILTLRLLGSLCVAATVLLLRELAVEGGTSRLAAAVAALIYAVISIELGGMATSTEIMFAPFTAGAVLVALRSRDSATARGQFRAIVLSGLLIGAGIWFKYIAAFPGCVLFAALAGGWLLRGRISLSRAALLALAYLLSCLLPTLATGAAYALAGHWDAFWYCNIGFMPRYRALPRAGAEIARTFVDVFLASYPLLALACLGLLRWRDRPLLLAIALAWLAAEAVALIVPWKFWDHYFLLLMPPLCLCAAIGLDAIATRLLPRGPRAHLAKLPPALAILLAIGIAAWHLPALHQRFARPDPSATIAAFLRQDPKASVWVVNHEPVIYFLTGLKLPTVYAFPPHLIGAYSVLAQTDPATEIRRILAARPRYLVFDPVDRHIILPEYDAIIAAAIAADYDLVLAVRGRVDNILVYRLRAPA